MVATGLSTDADTPDSSVVSAIVISHLWYCTYLMRNKLSDEVSKGYILMCRVKGLTRNQIMYRHCLKNIMPSVISIMAIFLPHLLGRCLCYRDGIRLSGLGKLGVESAQFHDYNTLMVVCLVTGAAVITANMIAQVINEKLWLLRLKKRGGRCCEIKTKSSSELSCGFHHCPCCYYLGGCLISPTSSFLTIRPEWIHPIGNKYGTRQPAHLRYGRWPDAIFFSVIWYGGRISLIVGLLATLISTFIAVVYGAASGLASDRIDDVMMRFTEIVMSIPQILLVMFIQALMGNATVWSMLLCIGNNGMDGSSKDGAERSKRIENRRLRYGARTMGAGFFYILRVHLVPNFMSAIMFMIVTNISAIAMEATLQFLGSGSSYGNNIMGKSYVSLSASNAYRRMVDADHTRIVPGCNPDLYNRNRRIPAKGGQTSPVDINICYR